MTPELTALALAALLQLGQIVLAGYFLNRDLGVAYNLGPRDEERKPSILAARLRRAVSNHFEALALFTVAVMVVVLSGSAGGFTAACAWIYLAARVLYVPAYAYGWAPWRSVIFGVATTATLLMLVAAFLGDGA